MKKVYIVSANGYDVRGSKNVFCSLELAIKAISKKREEIISNNWSNTKISDVKLDKITGLPGFSFMTGGWDSLTGGWDSQAAYWKILEIDICESLEESNMFYDAVKIKREQDLKNKEAEEAKNKFISSLDSSLVKELEKHFQIKINK